MGAKSGKLSGPPIKVLGSRRYHGIHQLGQRRPIICSHLHPILASVRPLPDSAGSKKTEDRVVMDELPTF